MSYVVIPALVGLLTYWYTKARSLLKVKNKYPNIVMSVNKNERIQSLLVEIRTKFGSDRSELSLIHNGTYLIDGSELLKISRVAESAGHATNLQAMNWQNIPISLLPCEMQLLKEYQPVFVTVSELSDGKFKRLLISGGVANVIVCPVKNGQNIIGIVGLEYIDAVQKPKDMDDLFKYISIIEEILSSK